MIETKLIREDGSINMGIGTGLAYCTHMNLTDSHDKAGLIWKVNEQISRERFTIPTEDRHYAGHLDRLPNVQLMPAAYAAMIGIYDVFEAAEFHGEELPELPQ